MPPTHDPPGYDVLVHLQSIGDQTRPAGDWAGQRGSGRRIEGFALHRTGPNGFGLRYQAMTQDGRLSDWVDEGGYCGSRGKGKPLYGFRIQAAPDAPELYCAASFVDGSSLGPLPVGSLCRSPVGAALEAIRLIIPMTGAPALPGQEQRPKLRTLLFCMSHVAASPGSWQGWDGRYAAWRRAIAGWETPPDQVLMLDDASPAPPPWPDIAIVEEGGAPPPQASTVLYRFSQHLGPGLSDGPAWMRAFLFAARYAQANRFAKLVHVAADAFVVTPRMQYYLNWLSDGWVAPHCATTNRPETAIQVIAGRGLETCRALAERPLADLAAAPPDRVLPFTHVEAAFTGERYSAPARSVPQDVDWVSRIAPAETVEADDLFWWLPARAAR